MMHCSLPVFSAACLAACGLAFGARAGEVQPPQPNIETYGQRLANETAARHPEINILGMHTIPPGQSDSVIFACSAANRIGKKSDPDDLDVQKTGETTVVPKDPRSLWDVGIALKDAGGKPIGTAVIEIKYSFTKDREAARKRAIEIRDEISGRIPSREKLFERAEPEPADDCFAQRVVESVVRIHPELNILSIHAAPPGGTSAIVATSNRSKIGKKSDPDDLDVLKSGRPNLESMANKEIVDVGLPLKDARGTVIGVTVMEVKWGFTKDKDEALKRALQVRDEMSRKIPSGESLFEKG